MPAVAVSSDQEYQIQLDPTRVCEGLTIKMSRNPDPNARPLSIGAIQCTSGLADQPSQKRPTTINGPPTQASGKRRYSSMLAQRFFCFCALAR